jgi:hypothetical protein
MSETAANYNRAGASGDKCVLLSKMQELPKLNSTVIAGLDPAIQHSCEEDGWPGQARP